MSLGASSSQGEMEEAEAVVDSACATEAVAAKDPAQTVSQDEMGGMSSNKDGGKGADDEQTRLSSSPPVLCDAPPHVRKSLEAALKAVADQASAPPVPVPSTPAAPVPVVTPSAQATQTAPMPALGENGNAVHLTDALLAKLISTLSDSALGNPALLLQTLLGFSPEDYNDLLAALSESGCSYVDIIAAYLHNIRVMSEDSGSSSAALSGTLTRSLIEQYNGLLTQALRMPRNGMGRRGMGGGVGALEGQGTPDMMLGQANGGMPNGTVGSVGGWPASGPPGRRSFENSMNRGPSGLGFGRRSLDSARSRPPMNVDHQAQGVGLGRMFSGDHSHLATSALHQKRAASVDLGQMLSGGDVTSPTMASTPHVNPMLMHQQLLTGKTPEQLAGILENMHLQQQAHQCVHPGLTLPLPQDAIGHLGTLNPQMGMMAPTMPALQAGLVPNAAHVPVSAAQMLAGQGLVPPWTHQSGINGINGMTSMTGLSGQATLSQLHLMQQMGGSPQGWEHMATIDEHGGVGMTPEQVAAMTAAVAAARPAMPMGSTVTQGFPTQVANGSAADGFGDINA
eukprot:evm.model.scf_446EXC.8 EVM.evm.TU.scf_446EXC.8   scf_446EXC:71602-74067(-)